MKKGLKITLISVGSVVLGIGVILVGAIMYFRLPVREYYKNSEKAFVIPGTNDGFIGQGISFDEESENFFITGYMNDKSASPIYTVDLATGKNQKQIRMLKKDGSDFKGHAGGLSVHGKYVYVADGEGLLIFSKDEILEAENGTQIKAIGSFDTKLDDTDEGGIKVSFTTCTNTQITIGEFYRDPNYQTYPSHEIETESGETNKALAVTYNFDDDSEFGIDPTPVKAYSLIGLVQGMAFHDEKIYLSTSYSVPFSHIYEYNESDVKQESTISSKYGNLPLFVMDKNNVNKDYKIPPMSEEIEFVNDEMYTMCESASNKYIFGKLTGAKYCYKTKLW